MISIITVVKNGFRTIENTILSVINQDYTEIEYIVIDGISTDGTMDVLKKYSNKISRIVSEPDLGIYDAMNKGVSLASGEWIYFLGCDDVLSNPNIISKLLLNQSYDNYSVVYGNVRFLNSGTIYDGMFDYNKLVNRSICHQAIFYKKELFATHGLFCIKYITAADYVFNAKVFCKDSKKWLYVDEIIAVYNEGGASFSIPDRCYRDDSFEIRYNNFRPYVSKVILARIFWSSYFNFLISHRFRISCHYIARVIQDVGIFTLIQTIFISRKELRK